MKIKSLIAAAALAVVGAAAQAATPLTLNPVTGGFTASFSGSAASNEYTFDLTGYTSTYASVTLTANSILGTGYDITSALFDGSPMTQLGNINANGVTVDVYGFTSNTGLTAGLHTVTVNGVSGGNGAFTGTLAVTASQIPVPPVTPVPEPAALAMMLAGLGVVGFGVRRKRG